MVALVATMVTADPPAFGRNLGHLGDERLEAARIRQIGLSAAPASAARPSGNTQSRAISGGMSARVTLLALIEARR